MHLSARLMVGSILSGRTMVAPEVDPELVVGDEYWDFQDDFEAPAGGVSTFVGRAGWTGAVSNWKITDGVAGLNTIYLPTSPIFMAEHGQNIDMTIDYVTDRKGVDNQNLLTDTYAYLFYEDSDNYLSVTFDLANNRLTLTFRVGGVYRDEFFNRNRNAANGDPVFLTRGTLRIQVFDGDLRVWLNGTPFRKTVWSAPWHHVDISEWLPSDEGKAGIAYRAYRNEIFDRVTYREADIVCETIDGSVGRDAYSGPGASVGTVTYTGRFNGSPVKWVSRLIDEYDRTTVLRDWQEVTATVTGNSYSISEALPIGGPYYVEHGWIDADGLLHSTRSTVTQVGYRVICYGQSTSISRGTSAGSTFPMGRRSAIPSSSYNTSADRVGYMTSGRDPYVNQDNNTHWSMANALVELLDAPVQFEAYGVNGTVLSHLSEGNAGWTAFVGALGTRKGVIDAVIWDQGQGDTDSIAGADNNATYVSRFLNGVVAPMRAMVGNPALPFFISHMGRFGAGPPAGLSQSVFDSYRDAHRRLKFAMTAEGGGSDPNIHTSSHHNGLIYVDSYHPANTPESIGRLNERDAWSIAKHAFGKSVHDGRGPFATGMTRSGAVLTVAVNLNGATSLQEVTLDTRSGTSIYPTQPANRFKGWDFSTSPTFGTLLAVTSIAVVGSSLLVTLAADPGAPVYARFLYGAGYDDSVMVHGIYSAETYDRSIPLEPTMGATGYLVSN